MLELKRVIFDRNKDSNMYAALMRKLFQKYPAFQALEINHQEYVQQKLLGKPLYARPSAYQQPVKELL